MLLSTERSGSSVGTVSPFHHAGILPGSPIGNDLPGGGDTMPGSKGCRGSRGGRGCREGTAARGATGLLGPVVEDVLDAMATIDDGTDADTDAVSDSTIEPDMEWWGALWCSCTRCPAGVPIRGVPSVVGNTVCAGSRASAGVMSWPTGSPEDRDVLPWIISCSELPSLVLPALKVRNSMPASLLVLVVSVTVLVVAPALLSSDDLTPPRPFLAPFDFSSFALFCLSPPLSLPRRPRLLITLGSDGSADSVSEGARLEIRTRRNPELFRNDDVRSGIIEPMTAAADSSGLDRALSALAAELVRGSASLPPTALA